MGPAWWRAANTDSQWGPRSPSSPSCEAVASNSRARGSREGAGLKRVRWHFPPLAPPPQAARAPAPPPRRVRPAPSAATLLLYLLARRSPPAGFPRPRAGESPAAGRPRCCVRPASRGRSGPGGEGARRSMHPPPPAAAAAMDFSQNSLFGYMEDLQELTIIERPVRRSLKVRAPGRKTCPQGARRLAPAPTPVLSRGGPLSVFGGPLGAPPVAVSHETGPSRGPSFDASPVLPTRTPILEGRAAGFLPGPGPSPRLQGTLRFPVSVPNLPQERPAEPVLRTSPRLPPAPPPPAPRHPSRAAAAPKGRPSSSRPRRSSSSGPQPSSPGSSPGCPSRSPVLPRFWPRSHSSVNTAAVARPPLSLGHPRSHPLSPVRASLGPPAPRSSRASLPLPTGTHTRAVLLPIFKALSAFSAFILSHHRSFLCFPPTLPRFQSGPCSPPPLRESTSTSSPRPHRLPTRRSHPPPKPPRGPSPRCWQTQLTDPRPQPSS